VPALSFYWSQMTTALIKSTAANYDVSPRALSQVVALCPVEEDPNGADSYDIHDLAELLNQMGEDVHETVAKARQLMHEFGYIPRDSDCVAEGGSQSMYFDIMHGSED
jgi:hypothetical protein